VLRAGPPAEIAQGLDQHRIVVGGGAHGPVEPGNAPLGIEVDPAHLLDAEPRRGQQRPELLGREFAEM
jgi:hypothetical protein